MLEKNKNSIIAQKTLDNVEKTSFMKIPNTINFKTASSYFRGRLCCWILQLQVGGSSICCHISLLNQDEK